MSQTDPEKHRSFQTVMAEVLSPLDPPPNEDGFRFYHSYVSQQCDGYLMVHLLFEHQAHSVPRDPLADVKAFLPYRYLSDDQRGMLSFVARIMRLEVSIDSAPEYLLSGYENSPARTLRESFSTIF